MDAGASTTPDRIPSLDGLRAISIVMVLFGHLAGTRGFPVPASVGNALNTAELGVHIFFVISGFLITQLLLDELARKQKIAVGRFYLRRTLRIFPPYYLALWEIWRVPIGARFETVADAIAVGCVLAGTREWLHRSPVYMRALASPLFVFVPAIAVAANMTHDHPLAYFALGFAIVNVCAVLCVDWAVTFWDGRVGRVLNARPLCLSV